MRISQLDGQRVALWGWGREGRAAHRAIRARLPGLPLTLFCLPDDVAPARALADPALAIETDASAERLATFDVVVKSPGISPYRPEAVAAAARGTRRERAGLPAGSDDREHARGDGAWGGGAAGWAEPVSGLRLA